MTHAYEVPMLNVGFWSGDPEGGISGCGSQEKETSSFGIGAAPPMVVSERSQLKPEFAVVVVWSKSRYAPSVLCPKENPVLSRSSCAVKTFGAGSGFVSGIFAVSAVFSFLVDEDEEEVAVFVEVEVVADAVAVEICRANSVEVGDITEISGRAGKTEIGTGGVITTIFGWAINPNPVASNAVRTAALFCAMSWKKLSTLF